MYTGIQIASKYIHYYIKASNGKGHNVHSPFIYEFIRKVLNDDREYYCFQTIEQIRDQLKNDHTELELEDFGAGSRIHNTYKRSIADIATSSLKSKKFAQLLFRMVNFYQRSNILELGTSLGITTAYLASANPNKTVTTMEGAPPIAAVARKNFEKLQIQNIQLLEGNFDDILPSFIHSNKEPIDFAFIDGNHRQETTIDYFHQLLPRATSTSIFIFDDIHWSKEMEEAWNTIMHHPAVTVTVDLFFLGIVFFRTEQKVKQHFIIRF